MRDKKNPYVNDAYTLWSKPGTPDNPADQHRTSFATLNKPRARAVAQKMGLANTRDARCLACHAINPPDNLLEGGKLLAEGVTCNGCHGPSGNKASPARKDGGGCTWPPTGRTGSRRRRTGSC